jgi:MFS family permease
MGVGLLLFTAGGAFITIWGIWLTADFGLEPTALGFVATAIGISQLGGAGLSSLFIDRLGKRRGGGLGLLLGTGAFLLLPLTQGWLFAAIAGLTVAGCFFEFTVVSLIPLYSEQVPTARGTVMALVLLGIAVGGSIGPPLATTLWQQSGLGAVYVTAAICLLLAFGITVRFLQESPAVGEQVWPDLPHR